MSYRALEHIPTIQGSCGIIGLLDVLRDVGWVGSKCIPSSLTHHRFGCEFEDIGSFNIQAPISVLSTTRRIINQRWRLLVEEPVACESPPSCCSCNMLRMTR